MERRRHRPDFSVCVEGAFVAPGLWMIHATITYDSHLSFDARRSLGADARFELMRGIVEKLKRGQILGARSVRVLVEGDTEVAGFFELGDDHGATPAFVA